MDDECEDGMDFEDGFPLTVMDLCLCGRDRDDPGVQAEMVKAMALGLRYGIVMGGCLRNASDVFDELFTDLMPVAARTLERIVMEVEESLKLVGSEETSSDRTGGAADTRLH